MSRQGVALDTAATHRASLPSASGPVGWLPLILLPAGVLISGRQLAPWALMWALSIAIYAALKWLTWWRGRTLVNQVELGRSLGYLFLWPGLDAPTFLDARRTAAPVTNRELVSALLALSVGLVLLFGAVRTFRQGCSCWRAGSACSA